MSAEESIKRYQRSPAARTGPRRNRFVSGQGPAAPGSRHRSGVSDTLEKAVDNAYAVYTEYMQRGMAAATEHIDSTNWSNNMFTQQPGYGFDPTGAATTAAAAMTPMMMQWMQAMQAWMTAWSSMMTGMAMPGMQPGMYPGMQQGFQPGMYQPQGPMMGMAGAAPPSGTGAQHVPPPPPPPGFHQHTGVTFVINADRALEIAADFGPAACGVPLIVDPIVTTDGSDMTITVDVRCDPMGRAEVNVHVPGGLPAARYDAPVKTAQGIPVGGLSIALL